MKRSSMRGGREAAAGVGPRAAGTAREGIQGKVCPRRPSHLRTASTLAREVRMAAEGLTPGSTLPVWELEAWYQDLQEVLAASEPCGSSLPWGSEQTEMAPLWSTEGAGSDPEGCELDTALAAELLELESTAGSEPLGLLDLASSSSSPPAQAGRGEEEEVRVAAGRGVKRKRGSGTGSSKELAKQHQERANEQRVLELTAHNEQLRAEICRLSAEVESTRAALIDRMVNLQTPTPSSHGLQGLCTD